MVTWGAVIGRHIAQFVELSSSQSHSCRCQMASSPAHCPLLSLSLSLSYCPLLSLSLFLFFSCALSLSLFLSHCPLFVSLPTILPSLSCFPPLLLSLSLSL